MLPSEISISSLNSSNSLNVKTLMKKKYYKDKQLYLEFKWNDFVDTFENEEVFTNHVGTMCMPSATHDQSIVACEDV